MSKKKIIKQIKTMIMETKASKLMKSAQSVESRADAFLISIKRDLKKEILDPLVVRQEQIADQIYQASDFNLDTDLNKGVVQLTKAQCQTRFKKLIDLNYELTLVNAELVIKQKAFDEYFEEGGKA